MTIHAITLLLLAVVPAAPPAGGGRWIMVKPTVVTLLEEVEAPAQEAGVLQHVVVKSQQKVRAGEIVARLDNTDATLELNRAEVALQVAQKKVSNNVKVRLAQKDFELASQELDRAKQTNDAVRRSVTAAELAKKLLEKEKAALAVEDASHDLAVAQEELRVAQADVMLAKRKVARFEIKAPLNGVVAKLRRRAGEWVEPGDAVLRMVRIDVLQVEGFLLNSQMRPGLAGVRVAFYPDGSKTGFRGKLSIISSESNPADGRVRFAAEIENVGLALRAGIRGTLWIDTSTLSAAAQPGNE